MEIRKIAQSGGGKAIVRIVISKGGNVKSSILRHEGGASCLTSDDEALIDDLLATEVDGHYGTFVEKTDSGKTSEYYEDLQKGRGHMTAPRPQMEDDGMMQTPEDTRELDHGYGV